MNKSMWGQLFTSERHGAGLSSDIFTGFNIKVNHFTKNEIQSDCLHSNNAGFILKHANPNKTKLNLNIELCVHVSLY